MCVGGKVWTGFGTVSLTVVAARLADDNYLRRGRGDAQNRLENADLEGVGASGVFLRAGGAFFRKFCETKPKPCQVGVWEASDSEYRRQSQQFGRGGVSGWRGREERGLDAVIRLARVFGIAINSGRHGQRQAELEF
jgi:hypothetical protein